MANNPLENFNKEKLLEGIELTYKNAVEHFEAAGLLKREKHLGFAMTHLIYATEAAATASIILFKYLDIPVADELIKQFYSEHDIKNIANKVFSSFHFNIAKMKNIAKDYGSGKYDMSKEDVFNKSAATLLDSFREHVQNISKLK